MVPTNLLPKWCRLTMKQPRCLSKNSAHRCSIDHSTSLNILVSLRRRNKRARRLISKSKQEKINRVFSIYWWKMTNLSLYVNPQWKVRPPQQQLDEYTSIRIDTYEYLASCALWIVITSNGITNEVFICPGHLLRSMIPIFPFGCL